MANKTLRYNINEPQRVTGIGGDKIVIFLGYCVACNRRVYGYEGDHYPDPRGHIKEDHCAAPLDPVDYDMTGPEIAMCWTCRNHGDSYRRAVALAKESWTPKAVS